MANVPCQNCGAMWNSTSDVVMYHFASEDDPNMTSPALAIVDDGQILHCPKCPLPQDASMQLGDSRLLEKETNPGISTGTPTVVHEVEEPYKP